MQEVFPKLVSCKPLMNDFSHLQEVRITTPCFSVGRGLSNTFQIPYVAISRCHCKLINRGTSWIIEDNSTFGITVNNKRLGQGNATSLKHGDIIVLDPGLVFMYKFVCEDEGPTPSKRIKLNENNTNLINKVKNRLEKFHTDGLNHIEEKQHNNNKLEHTKKLLVEQLKLNLARKINIINNNFAIQVENLTDNRKEKQKQQLLFAKERDTKTAIVKEEIEQKIKELEEEIKNHHDMESILLVEKEYFNKKIAKYKEKLSLDIDVQQGFADLLYQKIKDQDKKNLQEKTEMMQKLKKITLQLKLEKEKELHELIKQKKVIENDLSRELVRTKQNINEQVELAEKKKQEVQVQLNEQIAAMKELEEKDKTLMDQLRHEKEEMNKKLIETQSDADRLIAELKAKVAAREEELAALAAEKVQKQAEQSKEVINTLQDQLEKVTNELKSIECEKQILLENTASTSGECTKKLGEIGDLLESELQCSVCAELFITPITLNCSHSFCEYCITMWKKKKKDCPICRTPIKSECRSLALDSFIEKMVEKLSSEMKEKRRELLKARTDTNPKKTTARTKSSRERRRTATSTTTLTTPNTRTPTVSNSIPIVDLTNEEASYPTLARFGWTTSSAIFTATSDGDVSATRRSASTNNPSSSTATASPRATSNQIPLSLSSPIRRSNRTRQI